MNVTMYILKQIVSKKCKTNFCVSQFLFLSTQFGLGNGQTPQASLEENSFMYCTTLNSTVSGGGSRFESKKIINN
jgi:hypothetical protein